MRVYCAPLTPMNRDASVDLRSLTDHCVRVADAGIEGFAILGTMGEFPDLTSLERHEIIHAVSQAVPDSILIVGVGAASTREACALAEDASRAGASFIMALPPLYWKLPPSALIQHFAEIAAASSCPLLVYDLPKLSGTDISADFLSQLVEDVPQVAGIKLSDDSIEKFRSARQFKDQHPGFTIAIGHRDLALIGTIMGADALISELANVAPKAHSSLVSAVLEGNMKHAANIQSALWDLGNISTLSNPPMMALKLAAAMHGSVMNPFCRSPSSVSIEEVSRSVEAHLHELNLRYPELGNDLRI